jgi:hypothetical protein
MIIHPHTHTQEGPVFRMNVLIACESILLWPLALCLLALMSFAALWQLTCEDVDQRLELLLPLFDENNNSADSCKHGSWYSKHWTLYSAWFGAALIFGMLNAHLINLIFIKYIFNIPPPK